MVKPLVAAYDFVRDLGGWLFYAGFDRLARLRRGTPPSAAAILVIRLDAIGDFLLFRPWLEHLRKSSRGQGRRLVLCGNAAWRELAEYWDANVVDHFIWLDRKQFARSLRYRYRKIAELTASGYEIAINPTFSRDLLFANRVMRIVTAKEKIGSSGDPGLVAGWRQKLSNKAYSRLLEAEPEIMFELFRNQEFFQRLLGRKLELPARLLPAVPPVKRPELNGRYGLLFVGASADYKKWPIEYFVETARFLQRQYNLKIVVCGGPGDAADMHSHKQEPETVDFVDLCGRTTLLELFGLILQAEIMVSNETVSPHVAGLAGHPPCVVVSCSGCFGRFFPYPAAIAAEYRIVYHPEITRDLETFKQKSNQFGFHNTMDIAAVTPAMVIAEIRRALEDGAVARPSS